MGEKLQREIGECQKGSLSDVPRVGEFFHIVNKPWVPLPAASTEVNVHASESLRKSTVERLAVAASETLEGI